MCKERKTTVYTPSMRNHDCEFLWDMNRESPASEQELASSMSSFCSKSLIHQRTRTKTVVGGRTICVCVSNHILPLVHEFVVLRAHCVLTCDVHRLPSVSHCLQSSSGVTAVTGDDPVCTHITVFTCRSTLFETQLKVLQLFMYMSTNH